MLTLRTLVRRLGLATAVAGLAALPFAAQADVSSEISTAQQHATFSAQGKTLADAHKHLYHVLNCLEGPMGKWFYAKQFDPCKSMGNGAINDATSPQQKSALEHLAARAHAGLMSNHLATAHHDAEMIAADLKKME